jgi:hypothetical protein
VEFLGVLVTLAGPVLPVILTSTSVLTDMTVSLPLLATTQTEDTNATVQPDSTETEEYPDRDAKISTSAPSVFITVDLNPFVTITTADSAVLAETDSPEILQP